MKNNFLLTTFLSICISCSYVKHDKTNSFQHQEEIINIIIDSVLNKSYDKYTICSDFFYEFNDSLIRKCLISLPDSIVKRKDINCMITQYASSVNKVITPYLDTSKYNIVEQLDNLKDQEFLKLHFSISVPLFSEDGEYAITYLHGYVNNSNQSGMFMLFKHNNSWNLDSKFIINSIDYKEGFHEHFYSLLPKLE